MNETIDLLMSRTSERSYAQRELSRAEKDLIIACAMRAPTAENIGQHFYLRKTGADFSGEMRRSVKVALNEWLK